jgi:hypothetical protein
MRQSKVLLIDAVINLALGVLLIIFSPGMVHTLGVPATDQRFYPSILGAVFVGIAIALVMEYLRGSGGLVGLGLGGAVSINLCGGLMLAAWLAFGRLDLPLHGRVFLWALVVILVVISSVELVIHLIGGRSPSA